MGLLASMISQLHIEFCLNPLNLYLVSWQLNFSCSAKNCATEKLLHLYLSNSSLVKWGIWTRWLRLLALYFYNSDNTLITKGSTESEFTYIFILSQSLETQWAPSLSTIGVETRFLHLDCKFIWWVANIFYSEIKRCQIKNNLFFNF